MIWTTLIYIEAALAVLVEVVLLAIYFRYRKMIQAMRAMMQMFQAIQNTTLTIDETGTSLLDAVDALGCALDSSNSME